MQRSSACGPARPPAPAGHEGSSLGGTGHLSVLGLAGCQCGPGVVFEDAGGLSRAEVVLLSVWTRGLGPQQGDGLCGLGT